MLWERSLNRSQRRREHARRARREAPRRKGVTIATGAAILASPVLAPLASASSARPGVTKTEIAQKAATNQNLPTALLSYGDTGEAVAAMQVKLRVASDGIFGPITEAAVKRFQKQNGLAPTGVVDTKTWVQLFRSNVTFYDETSGTSVKASYDPSASSGSTDAPEAIGGPDLSDRVALRDEIEDAAPPAGSDEAPAAPETTDSAPADSSPVSTGSGGCSTDGRIVTPVASGTVTGSYGEDRGDHAHSGEDIAAPTGTTVRAADCGTVSVSGEESGYGQMVCIQHAGGTTTCYAHLSERDVAVSEYVQAGQKIGEVGCTGSCTGPHVHFEVRQNGAATDPAPYLNGSRTISGGAAAKARADLPEGSGGIGGPSAADEAAMWGSTGGAKAPSGKATVLSTSEADAVESGITITSPSRPAVPPPVVTGEAVAPAETTAAVETTAPAATAAPAENTAPSEAAAGATAPTETTAPSDASAETTAGAEAIAPAENTASSEASAGATAPAENTAPSGASAETTAGAEAIAPTENTAPSEAPAESIAPAETTAPTEAAAETTAAASPAEVAPAPAEAAPAPAAAAPAPAPAEAAPAPAAAAPAPAPAAPEPAAPAAPTEPAAEPAAQAPAPTAEPSAPAVEAPAADAGVTGGVAAPSS
jgi:murein DD-endopeptidase MepM/ murein hydrolase activator NlpD